MGGVVGERPESGVRIEIARGRRSTSGDDGPWTYEGMAHTPDESFALSVTVSPGGDVDVALASASAPGDLTEKVRLIVRTAFKQAKNDGEPPPLRITRWRGNK